MSLQLLFLLFTILSLAFFLVKNHTKNYEQFHPPPGPKGLPIIGNLQEFYTSAPHTYLAKLAKMYGPILSLRFGHRMLAVVQSAKMAREVLQTQDLSFCSRPPMVGMQRLSYNGLDIVFSPYGEYFREIKKISVVHLLNSKRVLSFAPIRREEVSRLVNNISSASLDSPSGVVNLSELIMCFATSNICRIAFGKRYEDDERTRSRFHSLLNEAQAMFTAFFFADYFPSLWWLDKLTGQSSRLERVFKDLDVFYEEIINDHLHPNKPKSHDQGDIIDVLLHLKKERSFELTLDHIKGVLMNIFVAGTDTSAAMVTWAMTELVKNPTVMKKVQAELRDSTQNKGYIIADDLPKLEYFKAVVKETFRLHPAAPLLVMRETIKNSKIHGYDIPPKTLIYVNVWAIGRDPQSWKDPEAFMPERFLGSSIDFKGYDFELLPFGAGRRICPGLNLGVATVELSLANLLYSFDWEVPVNLKTEDIDTDGLPGITMHKKNPLCLVAKKFVM